MSWLDRLFGALVLHRRAARCITGRGVVTLLRLLAHDLGVLCPTAREFALQLVVATLGLLALGGIYVIGWAVWG